MNNLLKGIMKYRCTVRDQMVKQFEQVRDNPKVSEKNTIFTFFSSAMFVHCMRIRIQIVKTMLEILFKHISFYLNGFKKFYSLSFSQKLFFSHVSTVA